MLKKVDVTGKKIDQIIDVLKGSSPSSVNATNTQAPKSHLQFQEATIPRVHCITRGYDGNFYAVSLNGEVVKYSNITEDNPTPVETGAVFDRATLGLPVAIRQVSDGLLIFSNEGFNARIYKMQGLQGNPELKYETTETTEENRSYFASRDAFGIKSHHNGFSTIILAGVYGRGAVARDLLLSTDNGDTFQVVKQTKNEDQSGPNSHWHDVAIDHYHGYLWASEGDSDINRDVHYSTDMGATWHTVQPENLRQPTLIIPFPDKVVFGRDSTKPGIDVVRKSNTQAEFDKGYHIEVLKEFKLDTMAVHYYAHTPVVQGNEAYMYFSISGIEPRLILGTNDWGNTWHFVFMGHGNHESGKTISNLFGMDDQNIYAYGDTSGSGNTIVYTKKPEWVAL